jgi:hypothetical protein
MEGSLTTKLYSPITPDELQFLNEAQQTLLAYCSCMFLFCIFILWCSYVGVLFRIQVSVILCFLGSSLTTVFYYSQQ